MKELKEFRNSLKMTSIEMAEKIGVSKSLYDKVEAGARKPSREFTTKLKEVFPQFDVNIFFTKQ